MFMLLPGSGDITMGKIWSLLLKVLQVAGVGWKKPSDGQVTIIWPFKAGWVEVQGAKEDLLDPLVQNGKAMEEGGCSE